MVFNQFGRVHDVIVGPDGYLYVTLQLPGAGPVAVDPGHGGAADSGRSSDTTASASGEANSGSCIESPCLSSPHRRVVVGSRHGVDRCRPRRPDSARASIAGAGQTAARPWPAVHKTPDKAPVLSAEEELKTFVLPPGYHAQLVAKEPLVMDPIAIDFDPDGRLWVLEMPGFMSEANALNSREPVNDVVVLEDTNGDGVMDKRTVFADKLVLPRALKVLGPRCPRRRAAEPLVDEGHGRRSQGRHEGPRQQYIRPRRGQHRAQREQPVLGARQHDLHVRARLAPAAEERQVRDRSDAEPRPVGRDAGRRRPDLSGTSTTRRCSSTSIAATLLHRAIRTWRVRGASTIR